MFSLIDPNVFKVLVLKFFIPSWSVYGQYGQGVGCGVWRERPVVTAAVCHLSPRCHCSVQCVSVSIDTCLLCCVILCEVNTSAVTSDILCQMQNSIDGLSNRCRLVNEIETCLLCCAGICEVQDNTSTAR